MKTQTMITSYGKFLLLFLGFLLWKPIVKAQTVEGHWKAKINGSIASIEFRSAEFDGDSWADTTDFGLNELGKLPNGSKGSFSVARDAGKVVFTGMFDGNSGEGTYVFTLDKAFAADVARSGVTTVNNLDGFAFFRSRFDKDYITMLQRNGFRDIPSHGVVSMYALRIDVGFIQQFKGLGYSEIPVHNLISFKALHISSDFISGFQKLGYSDIPLNEFHALKVNGVTPEYVAGMQQKGTKFTDLRRYIQLKRNGIN